MAHARSFVRAQDPVRCDLCTGSKEAVKVYCNTCHVKLCQSCMSSHVSQGHRSHDMVEFRFRGLSVSSTECEIHTGNECEMRCQQCQNQVCTKCIISGRHKNHDFLDITDEPQDVSTINTLRGADGEIPPSETLANDPIIIQEFDSNNTDLDRIGVCGPDEVWTSFMYESVISCMDFTGKLRDQFRVPSDEYAADISAKSEDELYFCDWKEKTINKYNNRDKSIETVIRFEEWTPRAICVTSPDAISVCITCSYNDELCKIIQYKAGRIQQEIQDDGDGNALFPYKGGEIFLAENGNGDICLSLPANRSVEVVNRDGIFRFSYHGNHDVRSCQEFAPHGIATDRLYQILIADSDSGCINCVSADGSFIMTICCDLVDPRTLQINAQNDYLYAGEFSTGKIKIIKYMT